MLSFEYCTKAPAETHEQLRHGLDSLTRTCEKRFWYFVTYGQATLEELVKDLRQWRRCPLAGECDWLKCSLPLTKFPPAQLLTFPLPYCFLQSTIRSRLVKPWLKYKSRTHMDFNLSTTELWTNQSYVSFFFKWSAGQFPNFQQLICWSQESLYLDIQVIKVKSKS